MRYVGALQNPPRENYILAGESDLSGRGLLSEVPTFSRRRWVKSFGNDWTWKQAAEPLDDPTGQIDTVSLDGIAAASPSLAFGNALSELRPDRQIGLIPCARGGSQMVEWSRDLSRSTLYGSMIARAKDAALSGPIKGVVWYQGKNDTDDATRASTWAAGCTQLIAGLRADLGVNVPVVIVVIDDLVGVPGLPYVSTVQAQQRSMSGSGITLVESNGQPMKPDDARHLATAGLVAIGEFCATAMAGMLA
ncbi:sialate O-acetylesterase [Boseaceae bacterium BT-24-1]|nr:sialate O-acetylesterase [Boseaceae bacterium BT-24-1]